MRNACHSPAHKGHGLFPDADVDPNVTDPDGMMFVHDVDPQAYIHIVDGLGKL